MREIFEGATSKSVFFMLVDSTTGLGKTGLVYTDMTGSYTRAGAARTAITMATLASASTAWSSGGFVQVDATNQPGLYRFDVPNAAFATGAEEVVASLKATGIRTEHRGFVITKWNKQVASIPNAATDTAGGLPTTSYYTPVTTIDANVVSFGGFAATLDGGNRPVVGVGAIAAGAIDASTIATDAIGSAQVSTAAVAKIQSGLATPTNITSATGIVLSGVTHTGAVIPTVTTVGTLTTYSGNTPQTGDSYGRLGSTGSGLTSLASAANLATVVGYIDTEVAAILAAVDTEIATILADVATLVGRLTSARAGYLDNLLVAPPTAAVIAAAVRDINNTTPAINSLGAAVNASASGGLNPQDVADLVIAGIDTWSESLPGAYPPGSAGYILGTNLNATVSSRLATAGYTAPDNASIVNAATNASAIKAKTDLLPADPADASDIAALFATNAISVAAIKADTAAILDDTGTSGVVVASGSKTGYSLASAGLDSVVIETGINARQALAIIGAATAGKASGLATATATYYAAGPAGTSTARIAATTDADGNRTATTLTLPS